MKTIIPSAIALILGASGAFAQSFTGGSVSYEFTTLPDFENIDTFNVLGGQANVEFGFTPQWSVGVSYANTEFRLDDDGYKQSLATSNVLLHGIYHMNDTTSFGVFTGTQSLSLYSVDAYGAEAAYDNGMISGSAYVGAGALYLATSSIDAVTYGADIGYNFGGGFNVGAEYEFGELTDDNINTAIEVTTYTVQGGYGFGTGSEVYAKLGQTKIDNGGTTSLEENIVGIGFSQSFGPKGGTTFDATAPFRYYPIFF